MEPCRPSSGCPGPSSSRPLSPPSRDVETRHPETTAESPLPPPSPKVRKYRAFLCHAGAEKQSIVSFVLYAIDLHKKSSEVFYDERMPREHAYNDTLEQSISNALYGTETLVVFLSWEFLRRKWPWLEVKTFLGMMERERDRKKMFPIFYGISAKDCKILAKGKDVSEAPYLCSEIRAEHRELLGRITRYAGINAQLSDRKMTDKEVVQKVMQSLFDIDVPLANLGSSEATFPQAILPRAVEDGEVYVKRKAEMSEVERLKEVVAVKSKEGSKSFVERLCISGMAFSGKTTIACNIAAQLVLEFPNQYFVEMRGCDGPAMSICDAMKVPIAQSGTLSKDNDILKEENPDKVYWFYSRVVQGGRSPTLIVIDDICESQVKDVCRYMIPATISSPLLVVATSRDVTAVNKLRRSGHFREINVSTLGEDEMMDLFRRGSKSQLCETSEDQLKLASGLCLPVIGWARIVATSVAYSDLEKSLEEISLVMGEEEENPRLILEWSVGEMKKSKLGEAAVALLKVLSVFRQSFSKDAALEVGRKGGGEALSVLRGELALKILVRYAFISGCTGEVFDLESRKSDAGTRYIMHEAVRQEVRRLDSLEWSQAEVSMHEASHSCYFGRLLNAAIESQDFSDLIRIFTQERTNLREGMSYCGSNYFRSNLNNLAGVPRHCLDLLDRGTAEKALVREIELKAGQGDLEYARLLALHGDILNDECKYLDAIAEYRTGIEVLDSLGLEESLRWADWKVKIGRSLRMLRKTEEAIPHYEEALVALEETGHRESENYAFALSEIGNVLRDMCRYEEAIKRNEEAVKIYEGLGARESIDCAVALTSTGCTLRSLYRFEEAIKHCEEAVQIYERLGLGESVKCAHAIFGIGQASKMLDRYKEAIKHHEEAVKIYKRLGLGESAICALAISGIGEALKRLHRYKEAIKHHEEAVKIYETLGLGDSLHCASAISGIGDALNSLDRYKEAIRHQEEAVKIFERLGLRESLDCALALSRKGDVLCSLDRCEEAINHHDAAVKIIEKLKLRESVNGAWSISKIGDTLCSLCRYEEAITHHEGAVRTYESLGLRESVDCADSLSRIGNALRCLGRYGEAMKYHEESIEIFEKLGLRESAACAEIIGDKGDVLRGLDKNDEALRLFKEAICIYEDLGMQDSLKYAVSVGQLSKALKEKGLLDSALTNVNSAISICEKLEMQSSSTYKWLDSVRRELLEELSRKPPSTPSISPPSEAASSSS